MTPCEGAAARLAREVFDGRAEWDGMHGLLESAGLDAAIDHDRRRPPQAPVRVSDALLADVAEDQAPDVGMFAAERLLGPWADLPLPRRARVATGAAMAFEPILHLGTRPVDRFVRDRPRPPADLRVALRAVGAAPPMVWQVLENGRLVPVLPLAHTSIPAGPVDALPPAPAAVGRAVPCVDGWWLAVALPLPCVPDPAGLLSRLQVELALLRAHRPRATWEDVLRSRARVVYTTAWEWCWRHADAGWRWPPDW